MKAILIGIAITIGVFVVLVFSTSVFYPQEVTDFFMAFGADSFETGSAGVKSRVEFNEVEEGIESGARLYLMKKMIAFHVVVDGERDYEAEKDEFDLALISAAKDKMLTKNELESLKLLHSDLVTDKDVENWIMLAKKYEDAKEKQPPEDDN